MFSGRIGQAFLKDMSEMQKKLNKIQQTRNAIHRHVSYEMANTPMLAGRIKNLSKILDKVDTETSLGKLKVLHNFIKMQFSYASTQYRCFLEGKKRDLMCAAYNKVPDEFSRENAKALAVLVNDIKVATTLDEALTAYNEAVNFIDNADNEEDFE